MAHTLFRVSVWDNDRIVAMARMIGDMGLTYYIKDVVVRPEYQHRGIGKLLIDELMKFINDNGVSGTGIFVELCAEPDKVAFYERFGFDYTDAKRLKLMKRIDCPPKSTAEQIGSFRSSLFQKAGGSRAAPSSADRTLLCAVSPQTAKSPYAPKALKGHGGQGADHAKRGLVNKEFSPHIF